MKFWPFGKTETRAGYTDAYVDALLSHASGDSGAAASETAAAEFAANMYSNAFASAEVMPDNPALTPDFMASAGRALITRGEHLSLIDVSAGRLRLIPASRWEVRGVRAITYRLTMAGPDGEFVRVVPADGVVHLKYSEDPGKPWRGVGPLARAGLTSNLAASLELRLGQEANARVAALLPLPVDGQSDAVAKLAADIGGAKGNAIMVPSTPALQGRTTMPQRDWQPSRLGANPPVALAQLRTDAALSILDACGVPRQLWTATDEGGQRAAFSRFVLASVEPLGRVVASELSDKLDADISFDFSHIRRNADRQARTVHVLTQSDVPLADALKIAELEDD